MSGPSTSDVAEGSQEDAAGDRGGGKEVGGRGEGKGGRNTGGGGKGVGGRGGREGTRCHAQNVRTQENGKTVYRSCSNERMLV
jgi:hypothetical protein